MRKFFHIHVYTAGASISEEKRREIAERAEASDEPLFVYIGDIRSGNIVQRTLAETGCSSAEDAACKGHIESFEFLGQCMPAVNPEDKYVRQKSGGGSDLELATFSEAEYRKLIEDGILHPFGGEGNHAYSPEDVYVNIREPYSGTFTLGKAIEEAEIHSVAKIDESPDWRPSTCVVLEDGGVFEDDHVDALETTEKSLDSRIYVDASDAGTALTFAAIVEESLFTEEFEDEHAELLDAARRGLPLDGEEMDFIVANSDFSEMISLDELRDRMESTEPKSCFINSEGFVLIDDIGIMKGDVDGDVCLGVGEVSTDSGAVGLGDRHDSARRNRSSTDSISGTAFASEIQGTEEQLLESFGFETLGEYVSKLEPLRNIRRDGPNGPDSNCAAKDIEDRFEMAM